MRSTLRPLLLLASLLLAPLGLSAAANSASSAGPVSPAAADERVVIIGFDGADGRTVEELMEAYPGQYPTFERLSREGTFGRLGPVAPPESPVSWAAINTGQNPAKTGVPGFVKRELGATPYPFFGHIVPGTKKLEELDNAPIPVWSPSKLAGAAGAVVFFFFLVVFAGLLRLKFVISALLSLALGGVGAWCGYTVRGLLPEEYPRYGNPNLAQNFWDHLAEADVDTVVLEAAQAFDMPSGARMLAGLGVPDAKGNIGDWAIYTTASELAGEPVLKQAIDGGEGTSTAGTLFSVSSVEGHIESRVYGPKNFWAEERLEDQLKRLEEKLADPSLDYQTSLDLIAQQDEVEDQLKDVQKHGTWLPLVVDVGQGEATIQIGDDAPQTVQVGEWSDYFSLSFELNWLLKVHAITRVKLVRTEPEFELFLNVLDIDPAKPPFWQSISTPFAFSAELADEIGPYETYGWPTATMPLKDEVVAPELLMEDVEFTMGWRERMVYSSLAKNDWEVFMGVFSTTDRVQHMMYQYYDEGHPLYVAEEADKTFEFFGETISRKEAIPAIYRQMDRILGTILDEHLGPNDTLLVCSDHGFQSFRRQVHINNFLAEKGYLATKTLVPGSKGNGSGLAFVDWSRTKAYCVGLGFIYLNLEGREPQGIVDPADADALLDQIRADLLAYEDPETGLRVCKEVYLVSEIHNGPHLGMESDLITGFAPTYRVSWGTTLGGFSIKKDENGNGIPGPTVVDNDKTWSGGHVSVALDEVAGVFFSNKKITPPEGGFHSLHIAPTALDLMGVPVPSEMDMAPLKLP